MRPARGRGAAPRLEHELKLPVPARLAAAAAARLAALAAPDPRFADNRLVTIYFDTPDLAAYAEKRDGEAVKTKVRLRWYEPPTGGAPRSPVFLEIKGRLGAARHKVHLETPLAADTLAAAPFDRATLAPLPALAAAAGLAWPADLVPVLALGYRRQRFVRGAARLALDRDIRSLAHAPGLLAHPLPPTLPFAVVEAKGLGPDWPRWLAPLLALGQRPAPVSKYAALLAAAGLARHPAAQAEALTA